MKISSLFSVTAVVCSLTIVIFSCGKTGLDSSKGSEPETPPVQLPKGTAIMFTGEEDHYISLQAAEEMMTAFQAADAFETYAWYFGRVAIEQLLAQSGAVGLRIYGGFTSNGQFSPVIFGVTTQGNDIVGGGLSKSLSDSIIVAELAVPCPPMCGEPP